ncbi:MAG: hypothetical protein WC655_23400 [Candidatus Hydrogenedentales bacterium]|jgi:hypothetical protein
MLHKLTELVDIDVAGKVADVRRHVRGERVHSEPKIRKLKSVARKVINGKVWIYWYWEPQNPLGKDYDCGYSGIREDTDGFEQSEIRLIAQ